MGKLETPDWIKEGYDNKADWLNAKSIEPASSKSQSREKAHGKKTTEKKAGKTYRVKVCPKCGSKEVSVILTGDEGKRADEWECRKCKWHGRDIDTEEISENEFLEMMERMEGNKVSTIRPGVAKWEGKQR